MIRSWCATFLFIALFLWGAPVLAAPASLADVYKPLSPALVPEFLYADATGKQIKLSERQGQWVLLTLWATWCGPCVAEMPSLDALQAQMGTRIDILPLSEDQQGEVTVPGFYRRHRIAHLSVAIDHEGRAAALFQARVIPSSFLIDPMGRIVGHMVGPVAWDTPESVAFLLSLISG